MLELPGRVLRDIENVVAARNGVLHGPDGAQKPVVNEAYRSVLQVVQQICLTHPSFPLEGHGVILALIRDEISALEAALAPTG